MVDGIAASAASVICMAGDEVLMAPTALMMTHNPASLIFGEVADLQHGIEMLNEVKESTINAYQLKTGLSRAKISKLMDSETWMNAGKAIELGFADGMLYNNTQNTVLAEEAAPFMWNSTSMLHSVMAAMRGKLDKKVSPVPPAPPSAPQDNRTPIESHDKRLSLLSH